MTPVDHVKAQPRKNWCGPAALRNAFLWLGKRVCVRRIARLAGSDWRGTDEGQLARAASALGGVIRHVKATTPEEAWTVLRGLLDGAAATPVLMCVNHYGHWIVAVKASTRHVWICDSVGQWDGPSDLPVYQRHAWRPLLRRVCYGLPDEIRFDFYPLSSEVE